MLLIKCPWCGERAQTEFSYGGSAEKDRPADPYAVSDEEWSDWIFFRDNPAGPHVEYWQHSSGCRRWLKVHRDTLLNEISSVEDVDPTMKGGRS